ncbi:MAG: hypothetical protein RIE59_28155 [Imperialibacter sp.]
MLKVESGSAGSNLELSDPGQCINDLFGDAVTEVFVLAIGTYINEGQNRNGGLYVGGSTKNDGCVLKKFNSKIARFF